MRILSIWWGYCSGAALFELDEKTESLEIIGASSEERFNRVKNTAQFPSGAINWLRHESGKDGHSQFDKVVFASNDVGAEYLLLEKGAWSVKDYIKENTQYWKPVLFENEKIDYLSLFDDKMHLDGDPMRAFWNSIGVGSELMDNINSRFSQSLPELLSRETGVSIESIHRVDHHESHIYYGVYTHPNKPKKILVFSVDGWGDGRNATVSLFTRVGKSYERQEINSSSSCNLAKIYRYMTLLLGMKPSEHEFKVMGLASYSKKSYSDNAFSVFDSAMKFIEGEFIINENVTDSYYWFRDKLEGERFDNIAGGLQRWLEKVLLEWVSYYVDKLNVNDIVMVGGVSMNVSAIGVLSRQSWINSVHVPPSAGDESHVFGAAYASRFVLDNADIDRCATQNIPYLGYEDCEEEKTISEFSRMMEDKNDASIQSIKITRAPDARLLARSLSDGYIVALARGRAEFGARALGNRSLLMDPTNPQLKEKLNLSIKNRDFWMPFAPVILDSYVNQYLEKSSVNLDDEMILNRFMSSTWDTTERGAIDMLSATHPADRTCRAQILSATDNEFLYSILFEFSELTGRGALLNTSFNTHGHPIVNTSRDALEVFLATEIDVLCLNKAVIWK